MSDKDSRTAGIDRATLRTQAAAFSAAFGRRPRVLVARPATPDERDGAPVVAAAFADAGFDVDMGVAAQSASDITRAAVDNDVHALAVTVPPDGRQAAALVADLRAGLATLAADEILIVCRTSQAAGQADVLLAQGADVVLSPTDPPLEAAAAVLAMLSPTGGG